MPKVDNLLTDEEKKLRKIESNKKYYKLHKAQSLSKIHSKIYGQEPKYIEWLINFKNYK